MAATSGPLDMSTYISRMTQLGQGQLDTGDQNLTAARSRMGTLQGRSDDVYGMDMGQAQKFGQYADADRALYTGTYQPLMQQQADFAKGYITPERMAANRAAAGATSTMATDASVAAAERALQGYNVDPSAGAFGGLKEAVGINRAKNAAAMMTKSDRDTEMLGQQYLTNAIQTGSVLPGQVQNEAGTSMAEGNAAINTGLATEAQRNTSEGNPLQWNTLGSGNLQEWGKGLVSQTNAGLTANRDQAQINLAEQKLQDEQSQRSSGIGSALGAVAGAGLGFMAGGPMGAMAGASIGGSALSKVASGGMIKRYADGGEVEPDDGTGGGADGAFDRYVDDWDEEMMEGDPSTPGVGEEQGENPNMVPSSASPSGGAETDDVTAQVNVGEFVVPKDVTSWLGEKFLQKLIEKSRMEMQGPKAEPEYAPPTMAAAPPPTTFASEGARGMTPA